MGVLDGLKYWTFDGTAFARVLSDSESQPWFAPESVYVVDGILDSSDRILDIGGTNTPALELRGAFETAAERNTFINKLNTTSTLARTTTLQSRSATATLVKAIPLDSPELYYADLTFEKL
jgi:hypothetical protein